MIISHYFKIINFSYRNCRIMSKLLHLFLIFSTSFSKCLSFYNEYLTKPNENIGTSALKENNLGNLHTHYVPNKLF